MSRYNDVNLPYHALKHVAIDLPSLLKQAAGLRPVCELAHGDSYKDIVTSTWNS